ncbi:hypothetical protein MAM1_0012c01223 [Mucor ambiguus]|uniref:F-box domain-containing protein n=1 Tax=Mucor ambiguus TaxID=91626 RepID=A0A0C9MIR2_9FUNG|nr:hypothetical protein MAM1_0012c01223 [Mucor ambiguus]
MGTTINSLPLEIVEIVCLHLWSTDLAQVSSVCHKWHQAVGFKLFRNVGFTTEKNLVQFIDFLGDNSFPYGSLAERIHFDIVRVFSTGRFVSHVQRLFYFCPNAQFISSNEVFSITILQSLSSLPTDTKLSCLMTIPIVDYNVYYSLCAKKFSQSLIELDLRNLVSDKNLVLSQEFPRLKRLTLGLTDKPFDLIDSIMMKSSHLEYLSFDLISSQFGTSFPATDVYPSLLELKMLSRVKEDFDYIALNTFLLRLVNLEKLTVSIFDMINNNQPPDQLYAFRDFIAWVNTVHDGKICIRNTRPENLLTYLKYICNTIPPHKEDWKTKIAFLRSSYYSDSVISYSTRTGYRERTFAVTLDNYFAKNFVCNYLNKLQIPFTVWVQ